MSEEENQNYFFPNLSESDISSLLFAAMSLPFEQAQLIIPGLEKFTITDLKIAFSKYLKDPPQLKSPSNEILYTEPFTPDEDCALLLFLRSNKKNIIDFLEEFGQNIHPYRSLTSIKRRIDQLKKMSSKEIDQIIDKLTAEIIKEEEISMINDQNEEMTKYGLTPVNFYHVKSNYSPAIPRSPGKHIDQEIDDLMKKAPILSYGGATSDHNMEFLATLRGENVSYAMRREAILIGRATNYHEVDIDLTNERDKSIIHISRLLAIISFLQDRNFYIENIGNRPFRVNGVIINPGKICRIPQYAILDFSNVMFMFIPNHRFLNMLGKFMNSNQNN